MKKYLLAGLLVWTPPAITVWVLTWLLGAMDGLFAWLLSLPQALLPPSAHASIEQLRHVPGLAIWTSMPPSTVPLSPVRMGVFQQVSYCGADQNRLPGGA